MFHFDVDSGLSVQNNIISKMNKHPALLGNESFVKYSMMYTLCTSISGGPWLYCIHIGL